jgi:hypothetical protein
LLAIFALVIGLAGTVLVAMSIADPAPAALGAGRSATR